MFRNSFELSIAEFYGTYVYQTPDPQALSPTSAEKRAPNYYIHSLFAKMILENPFIVSA